MYRLICVIYSNHVHVFPRTINSLIKVILDKPRYYPRSFIYIKLYYIRTKIILLLNIMNYYTFIIKD